MEQQMTSTVTARYYRVRQNRPLFFADPRDPGVSRENLWARPGEYVLVDHPVLAAIVKLQRHKVAEVAVGEVIPKGSVVRTAENSPHVAALIDQYDRRKGVDPEKTPEDLLVGGDGSDAPPLSPVPGGEGDEDASGSAQGDSGGSEGSEGSEGGEGDEGAPESAQGKPKRKGRGRGSK